MSKTKQKQPSRQLKRLSKIDKIQKDQIKYIENLGEQLPAINGVRVVKALAFELMQLLNKEAVDSQ